MSSADAVVIGAGPNGLVAAVLLADAGMDVLVLEAQPEPGGAVRSGEVAPGFVTDRFSSFYPLTAASPVVARMGLEEHGLRWVHAPAVLAHPLPGGEAAVLYRDLDRTVAHLDAACPGDGAVWRELAEQFEAIRGPLVDALFRPFPPLIPPVRLVSRLGLAETLRFVRFALTPVRQFADERFRGPQPGVLFAGNALHTDLGPEAAGSAVYGWLLAMLGQSVGFPVPQGGSGRLTDALVSRLKAAGGRVRCDAEVASVDVRDGRALGVRLADGEYVAARRAVVADVDAPRLYREMVGPEHLPPRMVTDLDRFQWDASTVKIDWALSGPVPWSAPGCAEAGTVHLVGDMDALSRHAHSLALGEIPAEPFTLFGQMTTTDPTRSPAGTESAWAYTHVPRAVKADARGELGGDWTDPADREGFIARMEYQVERFAPGFTSRIQRRIVAFPGDLQDSDGNLVKGALNGGTAALHQQLVFRPTPGLGRPETPVQGLYLASASAHPGGGVHGGPGSNAAQAVLHAGTVGRAVHWLNRRVM